MFEHDRSVLLDVFIQSQARRRTRENVAEQCFAGGERVAPQVVTVEFDKVEGVQENALIVALAADALEVRDSMIVTGDRLSVDDARAQGQLGQSLDNEREAVG